jgi:hypothetical protein
LVPEVPPAVSALIARMMAKVPGERFPTYATLQAEVDRLLTA